MSSTLTLQKRLAKLEQKQTNKSHFPNGCTKCEIVDEVPKPPDPDTFYIVLV